MPPATTIAVLSSAEVVDLLRRYLKRLLDENLPVKGLVLYGSYARGDARPTSGINIVVLLDDSVPDSDLHDIWLKLQCLTRGIDTRIETWPVAVSRYESDSASPPIAVARQEGIPLTLDGEMRMPPLRSKELSRTASQEAMEIAQRYLKRLLDEHLPVKGLVLYGSHARGDERPTSDIDVLVLLDDNVPRSEILNLWRRLEYLTYGIDNRIETWPVTVNRFQTDEVSPLIIVARQEGIPIAA